MHRQETPSRAASGLHAAPLVAPPAAGEPMPQRGLPVLAWAILLLSCIGAISLASHDERRQLDTALGYVRCTGCGKGAGGAVDGGHRK